ncbi:MFS transporter [Trueperella abortisuis]|uniref:MFS transporter n=1 Tax=Trueperella abortisuis TaxID=445930 RepID=UPI0028930267|nr:MFS transporter [Trueperella abortisuis]
MTSVDAAILPAVIPFVKEHFDIGDAGAGNLTGLFYLGLAVGSIFFGWLSDYVGKGYKRSLVWIAAMSLSVLGGLFTFLFASSWVMFQAMRVVMGVSRGGSETTNVALVAEWWQQENRGFAVGFHHIGFPLGQFVGPALITYFATQERWALAFLVIPMIGIPIMIAQHFLATKKNQQKVMQWIDDHQLTRPIAEEDAESSRNKEGKGMLEMSKEAIRIPNVWKSVIINFGLLWTEFGFSTFLVVFLHEFVGLSLAEAILASGASGLTGWFGQILWGTVSDHIGRKKVLIICMIGWIATLAPIYFVSGKTVAWVCLLAWGLFRNAPYPVVFSMVTDSAPNATGSALGLLIAIATGIGGALTAVTTGYVIENFGWATTFVVLGLGLVVALIAVLTVRETVPAAVQSE